MIPSRNSTVSFLMSSFLSNNGNWLRGKWRFRFPQWKCMVTGNRKLQMHVKKVQYLVTCLCLFCFLVHLFLLCFCFSYASRDKCLCLPVLYTDLAFCVRTFTCPGYIIESPCFIWSCLWQNEMWLSHSKIRFILIPAHICNSGP